MEEPSAVGLGLYYETVKTYLEERRAVNFNPKLPIAPLEEYVFVIVSHESTIHSFFGE